MLTIKTLERRLGLLIAYWVNVSFVMVAFSELPQYIPFVQVILAQCATFAFTMSSSEMDT